MISTKLITAPAAEPLALADVKAHLRVTSTDDDDYITALISVARTYAESYTRRAFITQTWRADYDAAAVYGTRELVLPAAPLQSISSVATYDAQNDTAVMDSNLYWANTLCIPGRLELNEATTWPTDLRAHHAVEVDFVAGYGHTGASVPPALLHAMLQHIAYMYDNRGNALAPDGKPLAGLTLPAHIRELYQPYRLMGI